MNKRDKPAIRSYLAAGDDHDQKLGIFKPTPIKDEPATEATDDYRVMVLMGVKGSRKISTLTQLVRHGAPLKVISHLEKVYCSSHKEISDYLSIPSSTINRRKKKGENLSSQETDRAVRYARLYKLAKDMMKGNDEAALRWLKSPKKILSAETPMQRATTEAGAAEVEQLIGRIRHGVFS